MESGRALEIINALASGIDPLTGEVFPPNSTLQNPDVIRALFLAATALESGKGKQKNPALPGKAGLAWSEAEDQELAAAFEAGSTEKELAIAHQRSLGAICSRLIRLGKLSP